MALKRIIETNDIPLQKGAVVYWMSRDQRMDDNWALLTAQQYALSNQSPLAVVVCVVEQFLNASVRQYLFMLKGLKLLEESLKEKNIPLFILVGDPMVSLTEFIVRNHVKAVISDFSPIKLLRHWKRNIAQNLSIPFLVIDAHNIVPCPIASDKQEFGAYTFRPKIHRLLEDYLIEFPTLERHPYPWLGTKPYHRWEDLLEKMPFDHSVAEVDWILPGEEAARRMLSNFIAHKLPYYGEFRNNPNKNAVSNLSPYLHYGQISAQRIALEIKKSDYSPQTKEEFLEELIVRRELSDNYCYYQENYDHVGGFPEWSKRSLSLHRNDKRPYLYSVTELENARTHDKLWNASQLELITMGKIHGYMRMYWAKKILEWSPEVEDAQTIAIYLNDKYSLDGRDPNGYTGIAWSIGGVHDRAWGARPIFGQVRYMNEAGCKRKFDVAEYIQTQKKRFLSISSDRRG